MNATPTALPMPMPDDVVLSVRNLSKSYPIVSKGLVSRQTGLVKACDDVSFDVRRGETLGIVGESGSGKTTLGRAILRATRPSSGQVLFRCGDGRVVDLATLHERDLKPLRPSHRGKLDAGAVLS